MGTLYDKKLKICNHAYAVDCKKEPLKAAPTITKNIKTTKHPNDHYIRNNSQYNHDIRINQNRNHQSTKELTRIRTTASTSTTATTTTKTTTESVIITPTTTTFEKTDPCLKKGFGINPREAVLGLDPNCEERLALTKKEPLKAATTTTEIIKTTVIETSEKTVSSPCLKKGVGINPRGATIEIDHNCEKNLAVTKLETGPVSPLPPCKLDIRLGDPKSDITFDTEKCDPNLPTY